MTLSLAVTRLPAIAWRAAKMAPSILSSVFWPVTITEINKLTVSSGPFATLRRALYSRFAHTAARLGALHSRALVHVTRICGLGLSVAIGVELAAIHTIVVRIKLSQVHLRSLSSEPTQIRKQPSPGV